VYKNNRPFSRKEGSLVIVYLEQAIIEGFRVLGVEVKVDTDNIVLREPWRCVFHPCSLSSSKVKDGARWDVFEIHQHRWASGIRPYSVAEFLANEFWPIYWKVVTMFFTIYCPRK